MIGVEGAPKEVQAASRAEITATVAARTARPRAPPCLVFARAPPELDVDSIYLFPTRRTAVYISVVAFWRCEGYFEALAASPSEV
jgi:hypothetical protein